MPALIRPESTMSTSNTPWANSLGILPDHQLQYNQQHQYNQHQYNQFQGVGLEVPQSSLGKRQRDVGDDGRLGFGQGQGQGSGMGFDGGGAMMMGQENIGLFNTGGLAPGGSYQRASYATEHGRGRNQDETSVWDSRMGMKRLKSNPSTLTSNSISTSTSTLIPTSNHLGTHGTTTSLGGGPFGGVLGGPDGQGLGVWESQSRAQSLAQSQAQAQARATTQTQVEASSSSSSTTKPQQGLGQQTNDISTNDNEVDPIKNTIQVGWGSDTTTMGTVRHAGASLSSASSTFYPGGNGSAWGGGSDYVSVPHGVWRVPDLGLVG